MLLNIDSSSPELPAPDYRRCYAKSTENGKPGLTVFEHGRNAGFVALALLRVLPKGTRDELGLLAVLAAALHDTGKISPGFQLHESFKGPLLAQFPDYQKYSRAVFNPNHAAVSASSLLRYFDHLTGAREFAEIVGMHHGTCSENFASDDLSFANGGADWAQQRENFIRRMITMFGLPEDRPLTTPQRNVIAGFVTVCDWISSDESNFPVDRSTSFQQVSFLAKKAVRNCGFTLNPILPDRSFQDLFEFSPHNFQETMLAVVDAPGVYVVEAAMGMGKTEAALAAAYKLMAAGTNDGIYFGLPTRLTSEMIHERVSDFLENAYEDGVAPKLAHGKSWLNEDEMFGGVELAPGNSWFDGRKRGLLSPVAVGTIDQALLSVVRVKHFFVRSFALANKVVILDEVHSYDLYTGSLIQELVAELRDVGATVIVLSATLTVEKKRDLLRLNSDESISGSYPMISRLDERGFSEFVVDSHRHQPYEISFVEAKVDLVVACALDAVRSGQCVLMIANSVATAQEWYSTIRSTMRSDEFELGLLHSRFLKNHRDDIEELWVQRLGKGESRRFPAILVATQVVEQSVDLDADFLVTELAPTDMLLQRMGRQWRHQRDSRPGGKVPKTTIVGNELASNVELDDLLEALGHSSACIYSPYVLWRSNAVWRGRNAVCLPGDIPTLLDATYRDLPDESSLIKEIRELSEKKSKRLKNIANLSKSNVTSLPTGDDSEKAATRYSDYRTVEALLIQRIEKIRGKSATITLESGSKVTVSAFFGDLLTRRMLARSTVSIPFHWLPKGLDLCVPEYLRKHFYDELVVLEWDCDSGQISIDGFEVDLRYCLRMGLRRTTVPSLSGSEFSNTLDAADDFESIDPFAMDW